MSKCRGCDRKEVVWWRPFIFGWCNECWVYNTAIQEAVIAVRTWEVENNRRCWGLVSSIRKLKKEVPGG